MADGNIIATVLTGAAVLVGVWRLVESVRRDLTAQTADVRRELGNMQRNLTAQIADVRRDLSGQMADMNKRIDNVLLADRRQAS